MVLVILLTILFQILEFAFDFGIVSLVYWLFSLGFGFEYNIFIALAVSIIYYFLGVIIKWCKNE